MNRVILLSLSILLAAASGNELVANSFQNGCLLFMNKNENNENHPHTHSYMNERVCNSDDAAKGNNKCRIPEFANYKEVRIGTCSGDRRHGGSSLLIAWIYQIILSEVFGVPAAIERPYNPEDEVQKNRKEEADYFSFYDEYPEEMIPTSSNQSEYFSIDDLLEADRVNGDCSQTNKTCSHIYPEVWDVHANTEITIAEKNGSILPPEPNGIIGNNGFFIPATTARLYPALSNFNGLSGDIVRSTLADIFKTPVSWGDYCKAFDCSSPDSAATRNPVTQSEQESYFWDKHYQGYFQDNNSTACTTDIGNCFGQYIAPQCGLSNYGESQLYWNKIALESSGPFGPNGGYSYEQQKQIWKAAHATSSHVFMLFSNPDFFVEQFEQDRDYSFHRVTLPHAHEDCITAQADLDTCSIDKIQRIGTSSITMCDYAHRPLNKVMSRGLATMSESTQDYALDNPAKEFLKNFRLPDFTLQNIFDHMNAIDPEDLTTLSAREATCVWVYENFEGLTRYFPEMYPRQKVQKIRNHISSVGYFFGSFALVFTFVSIGFLYKWKDHPIITSAQTEVLYPMIIGFAFTAISSLLYANTSPSITTCATKEWAKSIGFCLSMVPILLKLSTLNKIWQVSRNFRRVHLDPKNLSESLKLCVIIVVLYLIIWTIMDTPDSTESFKVIRGEIITSVEVEDVCGASSIIWDIIVLVWELIILLFSTLLAFQSREAMQHVKDRHMLGLFVYSRTLFFTLRCILFMATISRNLASGLFTQLASLLLSIETIIAVSIYFVTKFVEIRKKEILDRKYTLMGINAAARSKSTASGEEVTTESRRLRRHNSLSLQNDHRERSSVVMPQSSSTTLTRLTSNGTRRRSMISGINIPAGGIPNLIKSKEQMETEKRQKAFEKSVSFSKLEVDSDDMTYMSKNDKTIESANQDDQIETSTKEIECFNKSASFSTLGEKDVLIGILKNEKAKSNSEDDQQLLSSEEIACLKERLQRKEEEIKALQAKLEKIECSEQGLERFRSDIEMGDDPSAD